MSFSGKDFRPMRCAHDIDISIMARITMDQWDHVACRTSRFIIVNVLLQTGVLDTTSSVSGVMTSPDSRIDVDASIKACEIFSGGFSGWTHAMRRLTEIGYPFHPFPTCDGLGQ